MTTDYHSAQEDFNFLISKLPPWVLSNFIMWLDIRVAEYKIFGRILSESEKNEAITFISGNSGTGALNSELNNHYSDGTVQATPTHHQQRPEHQNMSQNLEHRLVHGHSGKIKHSPTIERLPKFSDSNDQSKSNTHQVHAVQMSFQDQSRNTCTSGLELRILESRGNVNTEEIHGKDDETRTPNVECINLDSDDEHEDEISRDPEDKKPDKGLLMELANESNVIEREITQETQSSGLVSVIKLELPDNDVEHNQLDVAIPSSDTCRSVLDNLPVIPSIGRWQPSSSSDIEIVTPDADDIATIEKTLNTGNIIRNYLSVSVSGMSNTSQSIEADNSNQDMTMYENIPFPGQELKMCNVCFGLFDSNFEVQNHFRVDHPGSVFLSTCIYCGEGFSKEGIMRRHIVTNHLGKRTMCVLCGKTFSQVQHFKGHLNTHRGVQAYKCKSCKRTFTYKTHLTCHERQCGGLNGKYECKICHRQFLMRGHLSEHMHGMHAKSKPRYSCDYCAEKFVWRGSCIRHKKKCPQNPSNL